MNRIALWWSDVTCDEGLNKFDIPRLAPTLTEASDPPASIRTQADTASILGILTRAHPDTDCCLHQDPGRSGREII